MVKKENWREIGEEDNLKIFGEIKKKRKTLSVNGGY